MFQDSIRRVPRPQEVARMTTEEIREAFLVTDLFAPGEIRGIFTDMDRFVVGGVIPHVGIPISLPNHKNTGRNYFLEQREIGIFNIGGSGIVHADNKTYRLERLDCLYLPAGTNEVTFESETESNPARFYFLSTPAHKSLSPALMKKSEATATPLGTQSAANKRTIYKYIYPNGIHSCQLVMGYTELEDGSVWNSFPPHTHNRRSEVYFYFDLGQNVVLHLMGLPTQTRHIWIHNEQAVLAPEWSIHAGVGTAAYKFIWGMAGENQRFDDMDSINPHDLR